MTPFLQDSEALPSQPTWISLKIRFTSLRAYEYKYELQIAHCLTTVFGVHVLFSNQILTSLKAHATSN